MDIDQIIENCGGAQAIAEAHSGKLTKWAVYKWPHSGAPDRYWPTLKRLSRVPLTDSDLAAANIRARQGKSQSHEAANG